MKKKFIFVVGAGLGMAFSALAAPGELDATFGTDGKAKFSVLNGSASSLAVQADGKILLAGTSFFASNDFTIVRFLENGNVDSTLFGTNGVVRTDFASNPDYIYSVLLQPDGKILAGGQATANAASDFAVARYLSDGTLDPGFDPIGKDGKVTTDFGNGNDENGRSMVLQPDGKIIVGGVVPNANYSNTGDFGLVRYNSDGSRDTNFGSDGRASLDFNANIDQLAAIALQSDGKIVAVGYTYNATNSSFDFALARFGTTGLLDSSFGNGGKITRDVGTGTFDYLQCVTVQTDGKIVVGGVTSNHYVLARYTPTGEPDPSFGSGGFVTTTFGAAGEGIYSLAVLPSGKIVAAGSSDKSFAALCYRPNGSLDTGFGASGRTVVRFSTDPTKYDTCKSVAIDAKGRVLLGGTGSGSFDYVVARLEAPYGTPTLGIVGKSKRTTARASIVLRGSASGNISRISCKVGRKSRPATGTTSWKISVPLKPGRNVVTITALSPDGAPKPRRIIITRA